MLKIFPIPSLLGFWLGFGLGYVYGWCSMHNTPCSTQIWNNLHYVPLYWMIYLQLICPITFVSVSLWSIDSLCFAHIGASSVEIQSEAHRNDLIECSHDDKPSTGVFAVYFCLYILCILYAFICWQQEQLQYCLCLFVCFVVK